MLKGSESGVILSNDRLCCSVGSALVTFTEPAHGFSATMCQHQHQAKKTGLTGLSASPPKCMQTRSRRRSMTRQCIDG